MCPRCHNAGMTKRLTQCLIDARQCLAMIDSTASMTNDPLPAHRQRTYFANACHAVCTQRPTKKVTYHGTSDRTAHMLLPVGHGCCELAFKWDRWRSRCAHPCLEGPSVRQHARCCAALPWRRQGVDICPPAGAQICQRSTSSPPTQMRNNTSAAATISAAMHRRDSTVWTVRCRIAQASAAR